MRTFITAVVLACTLAASPQDPKPQPAATPTTSATEPQRPIERLERNELPQGTDEQAIETGILRSESATNDATPAFAQRHPRYLLRSGDQLAISFSLTPELNQTVPVQPDGYISLKEVGDIYVAGKDLPQVREAMAQAYANILHEPKITVELKEFEKPFFIAAGHVKTPGRYEMRGDVTVTEAVAVAGGFLQSAKHSQVLVFRRLDRERVEVKKIDAKEILAGKGDHEDLFLRPGDMVYVPQNRYSKIKDIVVPRISLMPF